MEKALVLQSSPLFLEMKEEEISAVLACLSAVERTYQKGEYIFENGQRIDSIGLVLAGSVHILRDDFWGSRTIIGKAEEGDLFGEAYACSFTEKLEVDAAAAEDCRILFLDVGRVLTSCGKVCKFQGRLIKNLLSVLAQKNLMLTRKMAHTAQRTTREKLLSYLSSEAKGRGSSTFEIPFNRQQLADYLCVDRSAMSGELSKLKAEGLLDYKKNRFQFLKQI